jgi:hypothetical protein
VHSKRKGSVGELAVALDLSKRGLAVFAEMSGDLSKTDLVLDYAGRLLRLQVKSREVSRGSLYLSLNSSGPGYSYTYDRKDVDIFALFHPTTERIFYVPFADFGLQKTIAISPLRDDLTLERAVEVVEREGLAPPVEAINLSSLKG